MNELNGYNRQAASAGSEFIPLKTTNALETLTLKPSADFFKLGPGDILQIEILGDPGSQALQTVGPDGKIYYNLLSGLFVWGMTLSEAKAALETSLGKIMRVKPEVAVTLTTVQSAKIWLLGSVPRPGLYSLGTPLSLLEAVSGAGGLATLPGSSEDVVDFDNSFVLRKGQRLGVHLQDLFRRGDLSQNIYLQPDDLVYLKPAQARQVYVLGAVVQPNVVEYTSEATLVSVIARVGGTAPYAHISQVAVIRGSLSNPSITTVDFGAIRHGAGRDFPLQSGDIVFVPFRPFMKLEVFGKQILDQFVRTVAINEGQRAVVPNAAPVGIVAPGSVGLGF
jgi:polysaccharide export outer membrane protein